MVTQGARVGDGSVLGEGVILNPGIPVIDAELVTPHTEGLQAVVWHLLVSHPCLKATQTKWESVTALESSR